MERTGLLPRLTPFSCARCPAAFREEVGLKIHGVKRHGDAPVGKKKKRDGEASEKNKHKYPLQGKEAQKKNQCDQCGNAYGSLESLRDHTNWKHKGLKLHGCKVCGEKFAWKVELRKHMRLHDDEDSQPHQQEDTQKNSPQGKKRQGKYRCDQCAFTLHTSDLLNDHINSKHNGLKLHGCELCGTKFGWRSDLNKHMKMHNVTDTTRDWHQSPESQSYAASTEDKAGGMEPPRPKKARIQISIQGSDSPINGKMARDHKVNSKTNEDRLSINGIRKDVNEKKNTDGTYTKEERYYSTDHKKSDTFALTIPEKVKLNNQVKMNRNGSETSHVNADLQNMRGNNCSDKSIAENPERIGSDKPATADKSVKRDDIDNFNGTNSSINGTHNSFSGTDNSFSGTDNSFSGTDNRFNDTDISFNSTDKSFNGNSSNNTDSNVFNSATAKTNSTNDDYGPEVTDARPDPAVRDQCLEADVKPFANRALPSTQSEREQLLTMTERVASQLSDLQQVESQWTVKREAVASKRQLLEKDEAGLEKKLKEVRMRRRQLEQEEEDLETKLTVAGMERGQFETELNKLKYILKQIDKKAMKQEQESLSGCPFVCE